MRLYLVANIVIIVVPDFKWVTQFFYFLIQSFKVVPGNNLPILVGHSLLKLHDGFRSCKSHDLIIIRVMKFLDGFVALSRCSASLLLLCSSFCQGGTFTVLSYFRPTEKKQLVVSEGPSLTASVPNDSLAHACIILH